MQQHSLAVIKGKTTTVAAAVPLSKAAFSSEVNVQHIANFG